MDVPVLEKQYADYLTKYKEAIQSSDLLAQFLDTEEEEDYKAFSGAFEPPLVQLYQTVATDNPLQLMPLEYAFLEAEFEGLMISKILGFAILRGAINDQYHYKRPQEQLADILNFVATSNNFTEISNRIGQAVEVAFMVSSDIWTTSLIESVKLLSVRNFFNQHRDEKYVHLPERKKEYLNYKRQFAGENFYTFIPPSDTTSFFQEYDKMVDFLTYRILHKLPDQSYQSELLDFLENEDFQGYDEYMYLLVLIVNFVNFDKDHQAEVKKLFNKRRKNDPNFSKKYFDNLLKAFDTELYFGFDADQRVDELLDKKIDDDLIKYYDTTTLVAQKGFVHEDAIASVQDKYNNHKGLSSFNEALRHSILGHFKNVIRNLDVESYTDYFELNKTIVPYVNIFDNQHFNQELKKELVTYINKLKKRYTDKRGRDYQDIKKFVMSSFQDLGFMTEKELKEFFKTKRKPKPKEPAAS